MSTFALLLSAISFSTFRYSLSLSKGVRAVGLVGADASLCASVLILFRFICGDPVLFHETTRGNCVC